MTRAIDPTLPRFPNLRATTLLAPAVLAGSACSGGAAEREPACGNLLACADALGVPTAELRAELGE